MRLYEVEYSKDELSQIREELRREYPHLTEEQLDEILPLIPLAIGGLAHVARAGVGLAARGAMGLGKLAAKGVGAAARGVGKVAKGVGGTISQAGSSLADVGKKQIKKQIGKQVSNNLNLGGRTDQSGNSQQTDPAGDIAAMAQANNELQATYQAKVKEIEKSLGDMKKSLNLQ